MQFFLLQGELSRDASKIWTQPKMTVLILFQKNGLFSTVDAGVDRGRASSPGSFDEKWEDKRGARSSLSDYDFKYQGTSIILMRSLPFISRRAVSNSPR